ncbi:MAG: putative mannose-6-phosphate isomerase gmuF [Oscillospiraceae bacterium]|jgi:mannose-6-phosphate isomerase
MLLKMKSNRVKRPFQGGKLLEEFQGNPNPRDGDTPEEWVCSTVQAADGTGLSVTQDGRVLRDVIGHPIEVLVKLLDSRTRLMLQVHPDAARAKKYFGWPYGKTEAWHILGVRGEDACVYLGFRPGITRERWEKLFAQQDVQQMIECLHCLPVHPGDTFFVPAGVPHAMGAGVFFAEVQEPTDITLRTERVSVTGASMTDEQLHGGAGFTALFDCFNYDPLTREQVEKQLCVHAQDDILIGPRQTSRFSMRRIQLNKPTVLKAFPYAVVIVLSGNDRGAEYYLEGEHDFAPGQELLVCTGPDGKIEYI